MSSTDIDTESAIGPIAQHDATPPVAAEASPEAAWRTEKVRRGPVVIVLAIIGAITVGGAALSLVGGRTPNPGPQSDAATALKGQTVKAVPAAHALAPVTSGGEPPGDVLDALVIPSDATVISHSKLDASVGQFDRGISMTAPTNVKSLVSFYQAEFTAHGWSLATTQPTTEANGRTGTEVLAQRQSSDGYYWEVGVIILADNPSLTPALGGDATSSVSSSIDLRVLEVPDGN